MFKLSNKISGPKSAEIPIGLRDLAIEYDVNLTITAIEETGWLVKHQHVYFTALADTEQKLIRFQNSIYQAAQNLNNKYAGIHAR